MDFDIRPDYVLRKIATERLLIRSMETVFQHCPDESADPERLTDWLQRAREAKETKVTRWFIITYGLSPDASQSEVQKFFCIMDSICQSRWLVTGAMHLEYHGKSGKNHPHMHLVCQTKHSRAKILKMICAQLKLPESEQHFVNVRPIYTARHVRNALAYLSTDKGDDLWRTAVGVPSISFYGTMTQEMYDEWINHELSDD